ncbi:hypothetical protein JCM8097_006915 [Rhodosporidiobolus ruineniae]
MLKRTTIVLAAAATAASAQSLGGLTDGLSQTCTSAALSLVTSSDFATCASLGSLISVFTSSGSIVQPINGWLESVCASSNNCTDAQLQNATAVIDQGCATEESNGNAIVSTVRQLVENWNGVKEGLCLASTSNSTFCVTNLLSDIQNATATDLSLSTLTNFNASSFTSIPASAVCTDCSHALISKWGPIFGANSSDTITGSIAQTCGSSFNDGEVPTTVSEKSSSNSTSGNGAVESTPLSGAPGAFGSVKALGAGALAVAGGLALLA